VRRFIATMGSLLIVSGVLLGAITPSVAASTSGTAGPDVPGSTSSNLGSPWATPGPGTVQASDDVYATANNSNQTQDYGDFGLSIPVGSIIDRIAVSVEAKAASNACDLEVYLSPDGSTFTVNKDITTLTATEAVFVLDDGPGVDPTPWGRVWDPTELEDGDFEVRLDLDGCNALTSVDQVTVTVDFRTINDFDEPNNALDDEICEAADFNFIIDMSGSIGQQGNAEPNLDDLVAGINDFVTTFQNAGGDGRYSGTRFNDPDPKGSGTFTAPLTTGYDTAGTFLTAVNNLASPSGWTPTAAGINAGLANNAGNRTGVQNIGIILTDGSPNVPPSDSAEIPNTWLVAADAAIAAADAMRAANYHVRAVYLSAPGDPGDTTLPFSAAGDAEWAEAVMTQIGGGSFLDADFGDFADEILGELNCEPQVVIEKTADQGPFSAGDEIGFTVTLTNSGDPAQGIVVTDHLPAGIVWSEDPDSADWQIVAHGGHQDLTWIGGDLGNESSSVHISGLTDAADCGPVDNTASFTTTNDGQGTASASLTVNCPDLEIAKTPDNGLISAGDDAEFGITVTNNGPGIARDVVIDDTLPAGLTWTDDSDDCTVTGGNVLHCEVGDLGNDESFTVNVSAPTSVDTCGPLPNPAATADASNHGPVTDAGLITCQLPNIEVEKAADEGPFSAGEEIGFTVTIRNLGPGAAYDVEASDTLPGSGWSIDGPANGWSIDGDVLSFGGDGADEVDLANGASASVHVVRDTTFEDCGLVQNTVAGWAGNDPNATEQDPETAGAELTVLCPNLGITKTGLHAGPVLAGEDIGFRVDVFNLGEGDAFNVAVGDVLPAGFAWSITDQSGGWSIAAGELIWGPGTVVPEDQQATGREGPWVVIEAPTTFADCGEVENTAQLFQGVVIIIPFPPDTLIDEDSATEAVRCPEIGIDKEVEEGGENAEAGEEVEFTIDVSVAEGPVTNAVVTDTLPAGQTYVPGSQSSSLPATFNQAGQVLTWTYASLNTGDPAVTITYRVTIDDGVGGQALENTAQVCVDELGPEGCEEDRAVVNVGSAFDVSIEKSNDAPATGSLGLPTVENGDTITYTLDYTVFVDGLETGVMIVDVLPEGVTYVDGSATTDAQFTSVQFFPDPSDPLTDSNTVSGALVWTGDPAVSGSGSLSYEATADVDDPSTEDVDEGGAAQAQPLVNVAEICLGEPGENGGFEGEPIVCDEAESQVFVNEPPLALTPPPTDTIPDRAPSTGGPDISLMLILFGVLMLLVSIVTPTPAAARVRRDR
jgi:fimbrial isopeptide formation D2 family protein/uncharacterized repeat protein (TIGR01451 family)